MSTPDDLDALLTVDEIADRLRVSPQTVRRRIVMGELAAGNIGTAGRPEYRVRERDVREYERRVGLRRD